jgi:type IX secretion system PorP/SprF family membrane protein
MSIKYVKKCYWLFLLLFGAAMHAQQVELYTQYLFNTIGLNPAFAGIKESTDIFALYRAQWVGLPGAPKTATLSINGPVRENVGLGLSVQNDRIGPMDENSFAVDFSYSLRVNDMYKLAFGMKASANLLNIDFTKLDLIDPSDPIYGTSIKNQFSPNLGVGFNLYGENRFFAISAPNLLRTTHYDRHPDNPANIYIAKEEIHYYIMAAYEFELSASLKCKPAVLGKIVQNEQSRINFSTNFSVNDKFYLGMSYRLGATVSNMVGFQINDSWFIGYGYDLEESRVSKFNSGSHEVFLKYGLFR